MKLIRKMKTLIFILLFSSTTIFTFYYFFNDSSNISRNLHSRWWENSSTSSNVFKFSNINCSQILNNNITYLKERAKKRITYTDEDEDKANLSMNCQAIRSRNNLQWDRQVPSTELAYPIAFARAVYKDYRFIEMELAVNYAPQNLYCYVIDKKASEKFHENMHALGKCFDNVFVIERQKELPMNSVGQNMWKSLMECMRVLTNPKMRWKYLVILQNNDVQLKTNEEMVQIFKWLNGANDIQYTYVGSGYADFNNENWTLNRLHLFKNESLNNRNGSDGQPLALQKNKGNVESSLSRPFVEWILSELNVTNMLDLLAKNSYSVDEYFIQVLSGNDFLNAPGGFTQKCFGQVAHLNPGMTRFAIWKYINGNYCHSGLERHNVCILGLEDIVPTLMNSPFLFVNKMLLELDAEAIQCWHEELFNRNVLHSELHRLRKELYTQLPSVRFVSEKKRKNKVDLDKFDCHYKYFDEIKMGNEIE